MAASVASSSSTGERSPARNASTSEQASPAQGVSDPAVMDASLHPARSVGPRAGGVGLRVARTMEGMVSELPRIHDRRPTRWPLVALYDSALPEVYGYLASRCGSATVAEDLTSETFLAAVDAVRRRPVPDLTVAWLIGVARHKLVDHWRRREREERKLAGRRRDPTPATTTGRGPVGRPPRRAGRPPDPGRPGAQHRSALTLRYLDGLPVREVASCLGRTEGATEALLVRARQAFRDQLRATHRPRGGGAMTDPFDALSTPVEPQTPRPAFARELRARVVAELGLDPADAVPDHRPAREEAAPCPPTTTPAIAADAPIVVPYLAVTDGAGALDWYAEAFGAVEQLRVVGDDGRVGHAEFIIGERSLHAQRRVPRDRRPLARPRSAARPRPCTSPWPTSTPFARAVAAGATALGEPADQPHGNRHGTLVDPYGHRWMLSQTDRG